MKTLSIYKMEYYLAIEKTEIMRLSGKWMELKMTILSEFPRTQKTNIIYFLSSTDIISKSSDMFVSLGICMTVRT